MNGTKTASARLQGVESAEDYWDRGTEAIKGDAAESAVDGTKAAAKE